MWCFLPVAIQSSCQSPYLCLLSDEQFHQEYSTPKEGGGRARKTRKTGRECATNEEFEGMMRRKTMRDTFKIQKGRAKKTVANSYGTSHSIQDCHVFKAGHLMRSVCLVMVPAVFLSACTGGQSLRESSYSKRVVREGQPVPKGGGHYKIGKPYQINGKWYRPRHQPHYNKVGIASWYGSQFHGRLTSNGEVFDMNALTAAHPTLPLPSLVRVTNLENGKSLVVRVNDRGPYRHDRVIDLSRKVASLLGFLKKGTARVRVKYLSRAPLNGDDRFERSMVAGYMSRLLPFPRHSRKPARRSGGQSWVNEAFGEL